MFALQYDEYGNWLDSPLLVESVGTHEGPDFAEDESAYLSLVANLEGISQYLGTLKQLGGISQHYAIEAYEYLPNWEQHVPKSYYSQHLSQVQYRYTQENLIQAFWTTIKALWAKLMEMIKKGFYWLIGKKSVKTVQGLVASSVMVDEADVKEAEAVLKKRELGIRKKKTANERFSHTVQQMQRSVHQGFIMELDGKKREYHSLNELLDAILSQPTAPSIYRKFYFTTDPLWRDMVTNGPYTVYLTQVAQALTPIASSIENKLHQFSLALSMINGPDHAEAIPVLQALASEKRKVAFQGAQLSVAEILHHLRAQRHDWVIESHEPGEAREDYTLFSQKTLHYWSTASIEQMLDGVLKATPHYATMATAASKSAGLLDKAKTHFDESELGHTIRAAMENVISEVNAASALALEIETYLTQHRVFVDHSYALVGYFMRVIQPYLTEYGNDRAVAGVMQSLRTILAELKEDGE